MADQFSTSVCFLDNGEHPVLCSLSEVTKRYFRVTTFQYLQACYAITFGSNPGLSGLGSAFIWASFGVCYAVFVFR